MNLLRRFSVSVSALGAVLSILSCDVRQDALGSEPGVGIAPRFAAGTTVPPATATVVGRLSVAGRADTIVTKAYQSGGVIEFGTLPPGTAFWLSLSGLDSAGVVLWWSVAEDTAGSSPVKDVLMTLAAIPAAAGSRLPAGTTFFFGDTMPVPSGTFYTTDGSDPRTSETALPVLDPSGFAVNSTDSIRIAVRIDADSITGRPRLWSPVESYTFGIDVLDTITTLDSLILTHWKNRADSIVPKDTVPGSVDHYNSTIVEGRFDAATLTRIDSIPPGLDFQANNADFRIYALPGSPRVTIRANGLAVEPDSFYRIPFPGDSIVRVVVSNHGRSRTYTIRLVKGWTDQVIKNLHGLAATVEGLVSNPLDDKSWTLSVPYDLDTFSIVPSFPSSLRLQVGSALWRSTDTVPMSAARDTTYTFLVVDSIGDPTPGGPYSLQVIHAPAPETQFFLDTTWSVPWRDVPYDTLVDPRNGRKYRTIVVGHARWMAENLNYRRDSTFCPSNTTDSCSKYGRLYRWAASADTISHFDSVGLPTTEPLKGICPVGWHLPSEEEWRTLVGVVGSSKSGILLRSVESSWSQGSGEDSVGFRALPVGRRYPDPRTALFYGTDGKSTDAYFWTSTQSTLDGSRATSAHISGSAPAIDFVGTSPKSDAYSVRCVDDIAY